MYAIFILPMLDSNMWRHQQWTQIASILFDPDDVFKWPLISIDNDLCRELVDGDPIAPELVHYLGLKLGQLVLVDGVRLSDNRDDVHLE